MPLLCRKGKNNKKKVIEVLKVSCDSFNGLYLAQKENQSIMFYVGV